MKDQTQKQSSAKSRTSRQHAAQPRKSEPKQTASDELGLRDTVAGLDIMDIVDALPFYVMLVDSDHNILLANRAVQTQLGVKVEDILGQYCPQVIHGLNEPFHACPVEEAVEKGHAVEREAFDEDSGRWVSSAAYPIAGRTPDGKTVFFHMIFDITDRKQAENQLKTSRRQLRRLSARLESAREEERKDIAREIHDELGQRLTTLKIALSWLARRLPEEPKSLGEKTRAMYELVDTTIQTVQRISEKLRPPILDDLGAAAAVAWQVEEFGKLTGIKCEFSADPRYAELRLPAEIEITTFRIVQEALTNVARHAEAKNVSIVLGRRDSSLVVVIEDDGKGFDVDSIEPSSGGQRLGIFGMHERTALIGGKLMIESERGAGTSVFLEVPLSLTEGVLDEQDKAASG